MSARDPTLTHPFNANRNFSLINTSRIGIGMLMGHGQNRGTTLIALK